jgi:hypothetical protein
MKLTASVPNVPKTNTTPPEKSKPNSSSKWTESALLPTKYSSSLQPIDPGISMKPSDVDYKKGYVSLMIYVDIPLPEAEGRKKMFDINLKGVNISENVNWNKLVELTKGCSGADISNVCRDAAYMPMRRKLTQIGGIGKLQ